MAFAFDNSYARLPDRFFARMTPTRMPEPALVRLNAPLARHLGLDPAALRSREGVEVLAGSRVPADAAPLSMAYAGHQFGGWVPQLGDGRAVLLGEVIDRDGVRRDIQLKGSGRTPFSRMGDGRAALGPVLREYLMSEAMHALGVPTTRALAAVTTGETVMRERPLPGAILARVARSHVRVGTFQYFAARDDTAALRTLADYVIERHYPDLAGAEKPHRALLDAVVEAQARLVAQWMLIGFVHGVMNTDNTSIAAETIDYGPCAFLDAFDPATVFSSIDHGGRYAFGNQPRVLHWNLGCLAQTMLPLLGEDEERAVAEAQAAVDAFPGRFREAWVGGMRAKLGLGQAREDDEALIQDLLERMTANGADHTLTFRRLGAVADPGCGEREDAPVRALFRDPAAFDDWAVRWRARLAAEGGERAARRAAMDAVNPLFIPRNHRVEEALKAAVEQDDLGPFDTLMAALAAPFADQPERARLAEPPPPDQPPHRTFCGT
ncbi:MAG TPA: YdiU family protein [Thermohalobaculum sp.]|nr:YdiU family protein [Thermohalobaculum sp.]